MSMASWSALVPLVAAAVPAAAQEREETLIGRHYSSGGYGGPVVQATRVRGEFAVIDGARGGWIIDHRLVLGAAGFAMAERGIRTPVTVAGRSPELEMGDGGLTLEYIHRWNRVAHATASLLGGGGRVFYHGYRGETDALRYWSAEGAAALPRAPWPRAVLPLAWGASPA